MKDNSYDIPAMKFYVLLPEYRNFDIEKCDDEGGLYSCIPFEDFDGLRVKEIQSICEVSSFAVASAIAYKKPNGIEFITFINKVIFPKESLMGQEEMRIDKLFEQALEQNLDNDNVEKTYACFLERYQKKEYQEIKQLLKSNKK